MKLVWIKTILILTIIGPNILVNSQKQPEVNISEQETNLKLDSKLQKALVKVLTNLTNDNIPNQNVKLKSSDQKNEEKKQVKKIFDVHAFSAEQQADGDTIEAISLEERPKINFIITKKYKPTPEIENDATVAATNSVNSNSANQVTTKTDVPTTTTTPKPPPEGDPDEDDLDGANKDKVEEVQFFPASLVAAFTVQQDSLGLPHNVIPLFKDDSSRQNNLRANIQSSLIDSQKLLDQQLYQLQQERKIQEELLLRERQRQQEFVTQNSLNFAASNIPVSFEERKRILEQQLYELQQEEQRRQQELLLKERQRQQELEKQRLLQLQEEQRLLKLRQEEERRQQFLRFQREENQRLQQQQLVRQNLRPQNSLVSIFPSITLEQRPVLNQQFTPNREAIDFLANLRKQNLPDFPLEQNHIPLNFNQALPSLQQINIQQPPTFRSAQFLAPTPTVTAPTHNRVFRQEQQTSNLGLNTIQSNSFNSNFVTPPNNFNEVNRQLRNLLRQNGFINSNREELNVISKVLSLNHFGGDFHGILRRSDDVDSTNL